MKKFFSVFTVVFALAFIYAPIVLLFIFSFTNAKVIGIWNGFSFDLYQALFNDTKIKKVLLDTVVLAINSAAIATILGTIGAIGIHYNKRILGKITKKASNIPIINAEIVTAISLAFLFIFLKLDKTYFALLMGHVVISVPFVVLSILPKLKQLDSSLYEAALDLGASPFSALIKVVLPEIITGIFAGFMIAITMSLDDYMISAKLSPVGFETLSVFIYNATTKAGKNSSLPNLRALSSLLFICMIVVVIIMNISMSSKKRMPNIFKKIISVALCALLIFANILTLNFNKVGQKLVVYNCEEYIDEELIEDFEREYYEENGIKLDVVYATYDTPETLYSEVKMYPGTYDVVCPSDYMIEKMAKEGMLDKLSLEEDGNYLTNVSPYIKEQLESVYWQEDGKTTNLFEYAAGYMWGTLGLVYNPDNVDVTEMSTWRSLWNQKYKGTFTIKDSVRDTYFVGLAKVYEAELESARLEWLNNRDDTLYNNKLKDIFNRTDAESVAKVKSSLAELWNNCKGLEVDTGKDDIIRGNIDIYFAWSGDAVYAIEEASYSDVKLEYRVPDEGSNVWFDGWCITKASNNKDIARKFIEFISRPDNVIRNMDYIGYVSCVGGQDVFDWVKNKYNNDDGTLSNDLGYFFGEDGNYNIKYLESDRYGMFPSQYPSQDTIKRCVLMSYFKDEDNDRVNQMWREFKLQQE